MQSRVDARPRGRRHQLRAQRQIPNVARFAVSRDRNNLISGLDQRIGVVLMKTPMGPPRTTMRSRSSASIAWMLVVQASTNSMLNPARVSSMPNDPRSLSNATWMMAKARLLTVQTQCFPHIYCYPPVFSKPWMRRGHSSMSISPGVVHFPERRGVHQLLVEADLKNSGTRLPRPITTMLGPRKERRRSTAS